MTFINSLDALSNKITLTKYDPPAPELLITDQECIRVAFLDTETTGVDRMNDKIIELAIKVVNFERSSGRIVTVDEIYESFNDPDEDISNEIMLLTGIDNEMVEGQKIDWERVDMILDNADLIIAHNAGFDRAFLDRYSSVSPKKIWACSVNDINWLEKGFSSAKQELLCYWHGFYFDAHRAMNDVDAMIHLVTHKSYGDHRPLLELIEASKKPLYIIFAENFQYDPVKKDIVKGNKYRWNSKDKIWYKNVGLDELEREKEWLTVAIYDSVFKGRVEEINLNDKYKL